jgi:quinol monooxygenase YgiN
MGKTTILTSVQFAVREDQIEEFERLIAEFTARAELEPGTLAYRFFRGAPGRYAVIGEYEDTEAALAHQAGNQDLLARAATCTDHFVMQVHGPVGPVIREWAESDPTVTLYEDPVLPLG